MVNEMPCGGMISELETLVSQQRSVPNSGLYTDLSRGDVLHIHLHFASLKRGQSFAD